MPSPTKVNADRVRELLAQGCTHKQVCIRLGYSKSVVSRIATGKYEARRMRVTA